MLSRYMSPHEWSIATHMTQSLFKATDNIWVVVARGGKIVLPTVP